MPIVTGARCQVRHPHDRLAHGLIDEALTHSEDLDLFLRLRDAGVPIARPVAGIAMGLIKEVDRFAVLFDILGDEVDSRTGDLHPVVEGVTHGVPALEGRKQGWVGVDRPTGERIAATRRPAAGAPA